VQTLRETLRFAGGGGEAVSGLALAGVEVFVAKGLVQGGIHRWQAYREGWRKQKSPVKSSGFFV
jgi:hypothetical protein